MRTQAFIGTGDAALTADSLNAELARRHRKPADGTGERADGTGKPADSTGKPADSTGKPADGTGEPADGTGRPADSTELRLCVALVRSHAAHLGGPNSCHICELVHILAAPWVTRIHTRTRTVSPP